MVLSIEDLTIARGGLPLIAGLSFTLSAGAALLLRGPNGLGKTTLLRTIAGLQPPARGKVRVDPDTLTCAAHADGVKPALTVAENLRFWAAVHGGREIDGALAAMDLTALADRPAARLSAGQKRRLGLARLLVCGRRLWLLDEPTVSLDTASIALFVAMVRGHLAAGGAALIATHADLGLDGAGVLDLTPWRAAVATPAEDGFGGADGGAFL